MNESVDTNVLMRYFLADDLTATNKAVKLLSKPGIVYHVSDVVFFELAIVLRRAYGYRNAEIADLMTVAMDTPQLRCNERVLRPTVEMFMRRPKLSFADCYMTVSARRNDVEPLWTFDRKLAIQAGSAELVR